MLPDSRPAAARLAGESGRRDREVAAGVKPKVDANVSFSSQAARRPPCARICLPALARRQNRRRSQPDAAVRRPVGVSGAAESRIAVPPLAGQVELAARSARARRARACVSACQAWSHRQAFDCRLATPRRQLLIVHEMLGVRGERSRKAAATAVDGPAAFCPLLPRGTPATALALTLVRRPAGCSHVCPFSWSATHLVSTRTV